jgi:hypothetical protein
LHFKKKAKCIFVLFGVNSKFLDVRIQGNSMNNGVPFHIPSDFEDSCLRGEAFWGM